MEKRLIVSVCCVTYNHENYIADAIESFLMQRTTFPYEILIHDDASTDRTPMIIREYEKRYPGLIKGVYQKENQYSKGEKVSHFLLERARGKYIAFCEGDDFWTDPGKLQCQVEYMESHPECSLCVHGACHVTSDEKPLKSKTKPSKKSRIFSVEEVIEGGGSLFPTNSFLYPSRYAIGRPNYYVHSPVGDYPLAIYLATQGTVYYINRIMSAYRVGTAGSWTTDILATKQKLINHFQRIGEMLDAVNKETGFKYEETIGRTKQFNRFRILLQYGPYEELKSEIYKEFYKKLKAEEKLKVFLKTRFPGLPSYLKKIKAKWSP